MDALAFLMALKAMNLIKEEAQDVLEAYIEDHPELLEDAMDLIASAEASSTASSAHAKGSYFIYDGNMYCALADIAQGGSIVTSGTGKNCENVTVGGELAKVNGEVSELKSAITDLENEVYETQQNTYELSDLTFTSEKYVSTSGVISTGSYEFRISNPVSVTPGDQIPYKLYGYNNIICVIAAYDANDNFIQSASIYYSSDASSGVGYRYEGVYTVPNNVAKIRIGEYGRDHYPTDYIHIPYTQIIALPGSNAQRITNIEQIIADAQLPSAWQDKLWVCFGTSLTDNWSPNAHIGDTDEPTGKYPPYLQIMGKFKPFPDPHPLQPDVTKSNNLGIAGGRISGHILYYIRYYLHDNPNGIGIANAAELITIEGSVNDYAAGVPLGTVGDTVPYTNGLLPDSSSSGTFAGACYCAFKEAIQYAPKATVVFLTDSTGKSSGENNYDWHRKNGLNLMQIDYINMAKAVAAYVGIPVIDCGQDSMINAANPDYLADWIHHSYLGGYQYAKAIWDKLKNIHPKARALPN